MGGLSVFSLTRADGVGEGSHDDCPDALEMAVRMVEKMAEP